MLFAHIVECTTNNNVNLDLLPKYRVSNDSKLVSRLTQMPKVVHPLCERYPDEESCLGSDLTNWTLTVELKPNRRHLRLEKKPKDNEFVTQGNACSSNSIVWMKNAGECAALMRRRELMDKTKSALRQLVQTTISASEKMVTNEKQSDLLTTASSSSNPVSDAASDAEKTAERHRPAISVAHHTDRRRKKKLSAVEETWQMLDSALYQNAKLQLDTCSSKASVKFVYDDKKFIPTQIPMEQLMKELCGTDPRLMKTVQRRNEVREVAMSLPLPKFGQNWSAAALPDTHSQRPIDVVIGVGRVVAEAAGDAGDQDRRTTRICQMESLERSIRLLDVLDESEFSAFSYELNKFQQKIATVLLRHGNTHSG